MIYGLERKPLVCVITARVRESHIFTCSDSRRILPLKRTSSHLLLDFTLGSSYSSPSRIADSSELRVGSAKPYANGPAVREEWRAFRDDLSRAFMFPTQDQNQNRAREEKILSSNCVKETNDKYVFNLHFYHIGVEMVENALKTVKTL